MSVSRGRTMSGTVASATATMPYVRSPLVYLTGLPAGLESRFKTLVQIDPHGGKASDRTFSQRVAVQGQVNTGKSALMKRLMRSAYRMKAVDNVEGFETGGDLIVVPARSFIIDRKMGEYSALVRLLGGNVLHYRPAKQFNLFGFGMSAPHMADLAIEAAEMARRDGVLTGYMPLAITMAIEKMVREGQPYSMERAVDICVGLTGVDLAEYFGVAPTSEIGTLLDDQHHEAWTTERRLQERLAPYRAERVGNINLENFLDDAGKAAAALKAILGDAFGGIIGGEGDMRSDFTARVTSLIHDTTSPKAMDLIEGTHQKVRLMAQYYPEYLIFMPHYEFTDEGHRDRSAQYLRFESETARAMRAFHTAKFDATQYESVDDLMVAGSPEMQAYVKGVRNATAVNVMFAMPYSEEMREYILDLGFSNYEATSIMNLPNYRAVMKVNGKRTSTFFDTVLTTVDQRVTYTNQQTDKMMAVRTPAEQDPEFRRRWAIMDNRPIPEELRGA